MQGTSPLAGARGEGVRALPLFLCLLVGLPAAWACAGGGPGSSSPEEDERDEAASSAPDTAVEVSVEGGLEQPAGSRLELRLVLRNPGPEPLELEFSSGQRFDFAVRGAGGETVWRWSEGRFFTQALGSEAVPPGDSLAYGATFAEGLEPGRYTVVGEITARVSGLRDSVAVEVGGGP